MTASAEVREARDHPALEWPARLGMLAYGVVYLLVAWLAVQLALGQGGGKPTGKGALHELAQQPLGAVLLWLVAGGLAALALWEVCQVVVGHRDDDGLQRLGARAGSGCRAVVMGTLAVLAVRTALGDAGRSGSKGTTARLLSMPWGQALVVAIGLGVLVLAVVSVHRGLTDRWRKGVQMEGQTGEVGGVVAALARIGYVSRGVAFVVVGGLFVWAGWTHDADKGGGLDQAIVQLRDEPFGPWLMALVAVGLGCYGAFHLFRAWYLRST